MTRFLSAVAVAPTTGVVFQILLILFTLALYFFVSVYVNRFWNNRNEVSRYEQIIFWLVAGSTVIQCAQSIDPFSMNGIYSFRMNRVLFLIQGSLVVGPASLLLMDCHVMLLFAMNKKQGQLPRPYRILSYATIIVSVLTAFPVFVGIATNSEWADHAFLFHLISKFVPIILTIVLICVALKTIAANEPDKIELNDTPTSPEFQAYESNPTPDQDGQEAAPEASMGKKAEFPYTGSSVTGVTVAAITIQHANERTKNGLRKGIGQLIAVMIYLAMDLIDGKCFTFYTSDWCVGNSDFDRASRAKRRVLFVWDALRLHVALRGYHDAAHELDRSRSLRPGAQVYIFQKPQDIHQPAQGTEARHDRHGCSQEDGTGAVHSARVAEHHGIYHRRQQPDPILTDRGDKPKEDGAIEGEHDDVI